MTIIRSKVLRDKGGMYVTCPKCKERMMQTMTRMNVFAVGCPGTQIYCSNPTCRQNFIIEEVHVGLRKVKDLL
jgi:hypothetical protein